MCDHKCKKTHLFMVIASRNAIDAFSTSLLDKSYTYKTGRVCFVKGVREKGVGKGASKDLFYRIRQSLRDWFCFSYGL